jgi:ferritin-like metal-binding protein YciE
MMKNTVTNYLTKVSNNQIKSIVERKQFIITEALCENAINELKKVYWHEKELLIAIPMLLSNARTFELVDSLTTLSNYTKEHINLLEKQFPEINLIIPKKRTYDTVTYKNIV